jgi:hypothetical protein
MQEYILNYSKLSFKFMIIHDIIVLSLFKVCFINFINYFKKKTELI